MISEPRYNYVFVAVPKAGSSSMCDRLVRLGTAPRDSRINQHRSIQEYRQILGDDDLDDRFKFAFVRNPWGRLVSEFTMLTRGIRPDLPREWNGDAHQFQKWVTTARKRSQLEWLLDREGNLDVDFIGRFENIRPDFNTVLERINEINPLPHRKHWRLPLHNSSNNPKHYSEYYNDETIELVRERFRPDIEYFDYTYSGIAQAGRASGSDPEG